jgi:potassium/hydrogen antiporter
VNAPTIGAVVGLVSLGLLAAILSNRLSSRVHVPAPAIFLVAGAVLSALSPTLGDISIGTVQNLVTIALAVILFDGGMHIGWRQFRRNSTPILVIGIVGTVVTAALVALAAHYVIGFDWGLAIALGAALAATDPAVVFSVLVRRETEGRSGVILEGESGANDPVGIAMMLAIVAAGSASGFQALSVASVEFVKQIGVGASVGMVGGLALLWFIQRIELPAEALYPIRALAGAGVIFGVASALGGSGFLAVFITGIIIGDAKAPYKREVERFHSALASLGEIVAFTLLGLTVDLAALGDALVGGLVLAVLLAIVIRPLAVGPLLLPTRLKQSERLFILWSGLKGAVPILLGTFILTMNEVQNQLAYNTIIIVVTFSVVVQGGMVPAIASWLRIPMRNVSPQPWTVGVRFSDEPDGMRLCKVMAESQADGSLVSDLPLGVDAWISLISRSGGMLQVRDDTVLRADDEVLVLLDPDRLREIEKIFTRPLGTEG